MKVGDIVKPTFRGKNTPYNTTKFLELGFKDTHSNYSTNYQEFKEAIIFVVFDNYIGVEYDDGSQLLFNDKNDLILMKSNINYEIY